MNIESVKIDTIRLDPANARSHDDKSICAIRDSLKRFGQQKPIVVNRDNVVVAGNGTLQAATMLGWDTIDVVFTGLSGKEAVAFSVADNRIPELASWDEAALLSAMNDCSLEGVGFSASDLSGMIDVPTASTDEWTNVAAENKKPHNQFVKISIEIPPRVWIVSREDIISAIDATVQGYGGTTKWPK